MNNSAIGHASTLRHRHSLYTVEQLTVSIFDDRRDENLTAHAQPKKVTNHRSVHLNRTTSTAHLFSFSFRAKEKKKKDKLRCKKLSLKKKSHY